MKDEREIRLEVEELFSRIAPRSTSATNANDNGTSHGSTPEVPVGTHPQPKPWCTLNECGTGSLEHQVARPEAKTRGFESRKEVKQK